MPLRVSPPPMAALRAMEDLGRPFVLGGAPCRGHRYSVTGAAPLMTITMGPGGEKTDIRNAPPFIRERLGIKEGAGPVNHEDPFAVLSMVMEVLGEDAVPGPFPFCGGAAGFFSYDLKDLIFGLSPKRPSKKDAEKKDTGLGLPLMDVGIYESVYVYDHDEDKGYFVSRSPESGPARKMRERIEAASAGLGLPPEKTGAHAPCPSAQGPHASGQAAPGISSSATKDEFIRAVLKAKEYIAAGDIYQVNLSQRLSAPFAASPASLYEALIRENPTPFSSYFDMGGFQVISNSPELLLQKRGSEILTSPIKGTRPRGETPRDDALLREELAASPKERAEHVMIVDLERNDLGRVALPGTVTVENFQEIQSFRRLHHMVSTVRARAPKGADAASILKSIFPGGSITGAPKIRAMEVIEELETVPREIYTGSAGYMDFSGSAELSILIRTAITRGGRLCLHVGGGIVADSDPAAEYEETILKAMDFLSLLNLRPEKIR